VDDLVQWLGQQLDEDERTARAAGGASWEELPVSGWVHTAPLPTSEWQPPGYDHHVASAPLVEDRAHIVAHDPARVLREIAARRQALAHYARVCELTKDGDEAYLLAEGVVAKQLQIMATAYDHRPGYRDEWRP